MDIIFKLVKEVPTDKNTGIFIYLIHNNEWNDWYKYETMYDLYINNNGSTNWIGNLKIGEKGLSPIIGKHVIPNLPIEFRSLSDKFFSLGQDVSYYKKLYSLDEELRFNILTSLNDIAYNDEIYNKVRTEYIFSESIVRNVAISSIKGQYRRLSNGDAKLTEYRLNYTLPTPNEETSINFEVIPNSIPATNLHVIIGRNGVGKTHLLNNLIHSIFTPSRELGVFKSSEDELDNKPISFANIVTVSFSSFDETALKNIGNDEIKYYHIGISSYKNDVYIHKNPIDLQKEFVESLNLLVNSSKKKLWKKAISFLENDPIFNRLDISYLIDPEHIKKAKIIFNKLSSGHKIVLLTLTRLVEKVEEKSLVILDEPELHLHPPLLAAFMRALSSLLIYRNGMAIIATHSPVIVQEVTKNNVWIINRIGNAISCERPRIETFGENISTLTREIFGLEVQNSGFHTLLRSAVNDIGDYEKILEHFNGQLGNEAKIIVQSLLIREEKHNELY